MEEFKASPVPTLRLVEASQQNCQCTDQEIRGISKPPCVRRSTDPTPSSPRSPGCPSPTLRYRPRNTSPLARGHLRSRSTTSALTQPMSRAQSMPGVNAAGHLYIPAVLRSSSPVGSPNRTRTPRRAVDEVFPGMPNRVQPFAETVTAISEDEEMPRTDQRNSSPSAFISGNTFPLSSRRPTSPLRHLSLHYPTAGALTPTTPTSVTSSPSYQINKFNESMLSNYSFPGSSTSSSVPSTPNSVRSRSPSISSLETIPDSPDAEEAALEAERIAQLKAAADAADGDETSLEAKRASIQDTGIRGRTLGTTYGSRDKRKRWSVCGAERRGDLDLETIWED